MAGAELDQCGPVDAFTGDDGQPAPRHRSQSGCARAALEDGPLAHDRPRSELHQWLAVDFDREHSVEKEEQLVSLFALLDQDVTLVQLAKAGLGSPHDDRGQLPLESGLRLCQEGR